MLCEMQLTPPSPKLSDPRPRAGVTVSIISRRAQAPRVDSLDFQAHPGPLADYCSRMTISIDIGLQRRMLAQLLEMVGLLERPAATDDITSVTTAAPAASNW